VAGGWDSAVVLGSRSTDTLSGLGPPVLRAGASLGPIGDGGHMSSGEIRFPIEFDEEPESAFRLQIEFDEEPDSKKEQPPLPLRVIPGPRVDWLDADPDRAIARLCDPARTEWHVSPRSDRTGVRLSGPPVELRRADALASEGMVPGAVQMPPDGQPVILMANHATTGGYPAVAVVLQDDLDLLAQARPGRPVRFEPA